MTNTQKEKASVQGKQIKRRYGLVWKVRKSLSEDGIVKRLGNWIRASQILEDQCREGRVY